MVDKVIVVSARMAVSLLLNEQRPCENDDDLQRKNYLKTAEFVDIIVADLTDVYFRSHFRLRRSVTTAESSSQIKISAVTGKYFV